LIGAQSNMQIPISRCFPKEGNMAAVQQIVTTTDNNFFPGTLIF